MPLLAVLKWEQHNEKGIVSGLGRVRVTFWAPDPTRIDDPYPSHSGRVAGSCGQVTGRVTGKLITI